MFHEFMGYLAQGPSSSTPYYFTFFMCAAKASTMQQFYGGEEGRNGSLDQRAVWLLAVRASILQDQKASFIALRS